MSITAEEVYEYSLAFWSEHGYSPSFREIGDALGCPSMCTVSERLRRLRDEGRLDFQDGMARTIVIKGAGDAF